MEEKIKAVSEAFSIEPYTFMVGNKVPSQFNEKTPIIDRIEESELNTEWDNQNHQYIKKYAIFRGYDKNNNILFELIASACNVFYY